MTNTSKKLKGVSAQVLFQHNSFDTEEYQLLSNRTKETYRTQIKAFQQFVCEKQPFREVKE